MCTLIYIAHVARCMHACTCILYIRYAVQIIHNSEHLQQKMTHTHSIAMRDKFYLFYATAKGLGNEGILLHVHIIYIYIMTLILQQSKGVTCSIVDDRYYLAKPMESPLESELLSSLSLLLPESPDPS